MFDIEVKKKPVINMEIEKKIIEAGFTMSCEDTTGSILRTLVATKRNAKVLEIGTGGGISTSWILDGMDQESELISIDNDIKLQQIAIDHLSHDKRVEFITADAEEYITQNVDKKFDFIFADTYPGKFILLSETIDLLNSGGIYIVDDMTPEVLWVNNHEQHLKNITKYLDERNDIVTAKIPWSTGLIVVTKK